MTPTDSMTALFTTERNALSTSFSARANNFSKCALIVLDLKIKARVCFCLSKDHNGQGFLRANNG